MPHNTAETRGAERDLAAELTEKQVIAWRDIGLTALQLQNTAERMFTSLEAVAQPIVLPPEQCFKLISIHVGSTNQTKSLEVYDRIPNVLGAPTAEPRWSWRNIKGDYLRLPNMSIDELWGPIFTGRSLEYEPEEKRFYVYDDSKMTRAAYLADTILEVYPTAKTD